MTVCGSDMGSIPELELMSNFGIEIAYLRKLELINLELKFATKYFIHK